MMKFRRRLGRVPGPQIFRLETSDGTTTGSPRTASKTHGGFDNDPFTMNDILRSVLGRRIVHRFTQDDLTY
jgi:hypothetical protein